MACLWRRRRKKISFMFENGHSKAILNKKSQNFRIFYGGDFSKKNPMGGFPPPIFSYMGNPAFVLFFIGFLTFCQKHLWFHAC